jgi:hypothetical protein
LTAVETSTLRWNGNDWPLCGSRELRTVCPDRPESVNARNLPVFVEIPPTIVTATTTADVIVHIAQCAGEP